LIIHGCCCGDSGGCSASCRSGIKAIGTHPQGGAGKGWRTARLDVSGPPSVASRSVPARASLSDDGRQCRSSREKNSFFAQRAGLCLARPFGAPPTGSGLHFRIRAGHGAPLGGFLKLQAIAKGGKAGGGWFGGATRKGPPGPAGFFVVRFRTHEMEKKAGGERKALDREDPGGRGREEEEENREGKVKGRENEKKKNFEE